MTSLSRAAALALATSLFAPSALADQFTLMDVTFTFTKEQADNAMPSPSHYYVYEKDLVPGQPTDWTAPVDYRNGKLHLRTEVIDKPAGSEVTQWSVCYIPHVGIGEGYGCANTGTYTEEGVYVVDQAMTEWWQNDQIDWTAGIKEMHLVIKDSDSGGGHAHKRPDHEKFFPTTVRMTLVQVSNGATYDEALVPELQEPVGTGGAAGTVGGESTGGGTSAGGAGDPAAGAGATGPAAGGAATVTPGATGGSNDSSGKSSDSGGCGVHPTRRTSSELGFWGIFAVAGVVFGASRRREGRGTTSQQ